MISFCISILAILLVYQYIWKPLNYWKKLGIPQETSWPILGSFATFFFGLKSFREYMIDIYEKAGTNKVYGINLLYKPALIVKDLNILKMIMIKKFDHFTNHSELVLDGSVDPFIGKTLFFLKGTEWKQMRNKLTVTFMSQNMQNIFETMSKVGDQMSKYLLKEAEIQGNDHILMEMKDLFMRFTNDAITIVTFGIECDSFNDRQNDFLELGKQLSNLATWRVCLLNTLPTVCKALDFGYFPKHIYDFFRNIIKNTLTTQQKNNMNNISALSLLMETSESFSDHKPNSEASRTPDEYIAAQGALFFLGGFDTISTVLSLTCYDLAINRDVQKKLQDEIDTKFDKSKNTIIYKDIQECQYLTMVVSGLRKWTTCSFNDRVCTKTCSIKNDDGTEITILKGTQLLIPLIGFHYDPQYFPNPEKFEPERFSKENNRNVNQDAYMPFGIGPRFCIGTRYAILSLKIALVYLLAHFNVIVVENTQIPVKFSRKVTFVLPENGIHLGLQLRK